MGKSRSDELYIDDTSDLRKQIRALNEQVQALLETKVSSGAVSPDALEQMLTRVTAAQAEAYDKAVNPSNKNHPGISVFSYPEGDLANPRPPLKCRMYWAGYEVTDDTTAAVEIELLNQMEPGTYSFRRTDGTKDRLVVRVDRDSLDRVNRMHFEFEVKEHRATLPSKKQMLRDALGLKSPEEAELEQLRAQVAGMATAQAAAP